MSASYHKQSVPSEVDAKLCRAGKAVSKRSAAVECNVSGQSDKNKSDVSSRKSRVIKPVERYIEYDVFSSSDDNSNAVESNKVLKCVKPAVSKSESRCGNKLKSVCVLKKPTNVESVLSSLSDSDSDESVATKLLSSGKARATGTKSVSRDVNSNPKSKVNTGVNEKSKVNHSKLSHVSRRQHHRGKSVEVCSKSKSNTDERSTCTRRRTFIYPDRFNNVTPKFVTFKANFENVRVGAASQCLWD